MGGGTEGGVIVTNVNGETIDLSKVAITVYNETQHSHKYDNLTYSSLNTSLSSGDTLNVSAAGDGNNISDVTVNVTKGKTARVIIVYNGQHVLFDKEVKAL